ncbi:hypothetical protein [Streptomyces bambusae]|uniref:Uncharacterized protein n=1 Tax=Streptomyces bambusae TaxID=1550616 RepID=A0ABS6Z4T8_9ACTN|nr:hypothetical protein [Streptomyces bambusae]MBW5482786.1 hypothetical protein [Streptomyces bambusae]
MYRPLGIPDEDTLELFLGDPVSGSTAPPPPAAPAPEAGPVFVDASGRRQRRVRRWAYLLVLPAAAYVVLVVSSLLGGPTVQSPFLPSAQPPHTPRPPGPAAGTTPAGPSGSGLLLYTSPRPRERG